MREIFRDLRDTLKDSPATGRESFFSQKSTRGNYKVSSAHNHFTEKPKSLRYKDLRFLLPFVKPHRRLGLMAALFALVGTIAGLLIPLSFKLLADDAVLGGNYELLNPIMWALIGAFSLIALMDFFKQVYFFRFQQKVIFGVQRNLFNRLLRLPKTFFDSNSTGYLMSRVAGDVFQLQAFVSLNLVDIFTRSLQLVLALGILIYLNWKLTLLSVVVLPLFILVSRLLTEKTRRASRLALEKSALVSRDLQEKLSGAALIKAFAAEDREAKKIMDSLRDAFHANQKRVTITSFFAFMSGLINALGMGCVLWYGVSLVIRQELTFGELLAFSVYLGFLIEPAKFFANLNNALQHSFAAVERVFELMMLVPEFEGDETKLRISKLEGRVRFENVSFSYDAQSPALEGISFEAGKGRLIAIVGPSGAGKSTLVNLIISLYQPCLGQIFFDDIPSVDLNLQSLRERIGIVSQEIFLFNESIEGNIRYGRLDASYEEVLRAARIAGAHDFISELALGYDTIVGEKGVKLSEGQKQRLSIARAILKEPDLLIFDEAMSALDPLTEHAVHTMLREFSRGRTVFAIAHRLSTVMLSDLILVLDKGRIVQRGTHEQLWKQEGLYRQLCETQFISFDQPVTIKQ